MEHGVTPLFRSDDGEYRPPDVFGGSAGLNSAMWWACSICGASVLDMHYDTTNRERHQIWHDRDEDATA